ncbi:MAG: YfhO family protein [Clostridia bacterium]|nr:YfhO family protein [Clostridia bacterium]
MTEKMQEIRRRLDADRVAARIVRWGVLAVVGLLLLLVMFYAIDKWHTPQMPAGEDASIVQTGVYGLLSAALLAALTTTAIAAWHPLKDATPIHRENWFMPLMAGALALAVFCLGYVFLGVYPIGGKSILMVDLHHQYAPLLSELRHMLLKGGDLSYNFHIGMGSSFIPAFAYYLASPLNLLLVLFPEQSLTEAILLITLVKFTLTAAFFTAMAQYLTKKKNALMVAVGVMYALSGYMLAYSWNIMWLDVVALLPLVVMALEHTLKTGKITRYAVLLGLALFANYYIGFMLCVFLVLYWLVWALRRRRTLKEVFFGGLRFGVGSLWGAGMAAAILIPVALALGRTSAAGGELGDFRTNFEIFDLFGRFYYGATPTIRSGNLPNLYCGVAAVLLLPVYFAQKQIPLRRRLCYGGLLTVLLLSCTLTRWDLVWHGLHSPNDLPYRFSFLTIFVVLLLAAFTLKEIRSVTSKQILISLGGSAAYLVLWEKLTALNTAEKAEKVALDDYMLYINLILLLVYAVIMLVGALRRAPRQATARLLLTVVCAEMLFGTGRTLKQMNANEYYTAQANYIDNVKHTVINDALRGVEELAAQEGGFLRMEYLPRTSCVDTALHHYSGLTTFASSNPYCTTVLMGELGYAINGVNSYLYHSFVAPIDSLFGLRYVLLETYIANHPQLEYVRTVSAPDENGETLSYYVYRNKTALPIGIAGTAALADFRGTPYDPFGCQQDLYTALSGLTDELYVPMDITVDRVGASINGSSFHAVSGTNVFTATAETAGQYFAYVDCRAADDITVSTFSEEGVSLNHWSVTSYEPYIIDMGTLTEGQSVNAEIYTDGTCIGNVYLMRLDADAYARHLEVLQAGGLQVTEQTGHSIKGTVNAASDGTMFFSLPYDKGWTVYVDGSPVETFPVDRGQDKVEKEDGTFEYVENDDGAFLGAQMPAGAHEVTIVYTTPGGTVGGILSGVSLLALLIPLVLWILRRRADRREISLAVIVKAAQPTEE